MEAKLVSLLSLTSMYVLFLGLALLVMSFLAVDTLCLCDTPTRQLWWFFCRRYLYGAIHAGGTLRTLRAQMRLSSSFPSLQYLSHPTPTCRPSLLSLFQFRSYPQASYHVPGALMNMDAPPRSQVKGRCHSTVDRRESDQQHLPRSKSAAPAIMLPAVPANPNAPIVLQSALTVPQSEALLQISSVDNLLAIFTPWLY